MAQILAALVTGMLLHASARAQAPGGDGEPVGPIISLPGHTGAVLCIAFSPNGKFAATHGGLGDHSFHIWDVTKRKQIYQVPHEECAGAGVVWINDGRLVLSGGDGGRGGGSILVQDPLTGRKVGGVITHELVVRGIALSPDGKRVAAADAQGLVIIHDIRNGAKVREFAHGTGVNTVAFSPDGQWLISGSDDKKLRLWHVERDRLERVIEGHATVSCVSFAKDGKSAFSAYYSPLGDTDNTLRVWDVQTGKELAKLEVGGETRQLTTAAFSPDGRRALTGHENGEVCLWDLPARKKLTSYRAHKHPICSLAFSPDGRHALSGENCQGGSAMWLYRLP